MSEKLYYEIIVRDRNGRYVTRQKAEAQSFLKQYNQLLAAYQGQQNQTVRDIGDTDRTQGIAAGAIYVQAAAGVTNYGIMVGTGNTAVTITDNKLETIIAKGTGADQLEYYICTVSVPTVATPVCSFEIRRIFHNGSGGSITVREMAMYAASSFSYCIARDVLGSPVAVPNGGSITVFYTVRISI